MISAEYGFPVLVTKNGSRISYVLTNFIPNLSALNSRAKPISVGRYWAIADISIWAYGSPIYSKML